MHPSLPWTSAALLPPSHTSGTLASGPSPELLPCLPTCSLAVREVPHPLPSPATLLWGFTFHHLCNALHCFHLVHSPEPWPHQFGCLLDICLVQKGHSTPILTPLTNPDLRSQCTQGSDIHCLVPESETWKSCEIPPPLPLWPPPTCSP